MGGEGLEDEERSDGERLTQRGVNCGQEDGMERLQK